MKGISLRVGDRTLYLIDDLSYWREQQISEARRQAIQIGARFYAILGPPNEESGKYGDYAPETLARELRPYVVAAIDFLRSNGQDMTQLLNELSNSEPGIVTQNVQQEARKHLQQTTISEEVLDMFESMGASLDDE